MIGETQRAKVLKWPNREAVVGYVGAETVDRAPTDEWLYAFIGRNLGFTDFETLSAALEAELNVVMDAGGLRGPMIVHLGGFENVAGDWTPRIWCIRNTTDMSPAGYSLEAQFGRSDEIAQPAFFEGQTGSEIREAVTARAQKGDLLIFSFRQGIDLAAFNAIDTGLRAAMMSITHTHPTTPHPYPTSLTEWSKHVRIAVLGYNAYFGAFFTPYEQNVGSVADVVHVPWPENPPPQPRGFLHRLLRRILRRYEPE